MLTVIAIAKVYRGKFLDIYAKNIQCQGGLCDDRLHCTVALAVQEKVFVVFNFSLAKAHGTTALNIMSKFMFAKIINLYL